VAGLPTPSESGARPVGAPDDPYPPGAYSRPEDCAHRSKRGMGKSDLVGLSFPILTCRALTLRLSHDLTQRCAGYWLQVMAGMKDALPGPITHSVFASHG